VPPDSSGATVRTDGILRLRSARARPLD